MSRPRPGTPLVPTRRFDPELMDRPHNDRADLEQALRELGEVNRWLGGRRALLDALDPWLTAAPAGTPFHVLDVGTGAADLPRAMVEHGRLRRREVLVTAVDRDPVTVAAARRATADLSGVRIVSADARRLPFRALSFDVVTASAFLHHFEPEAVVTLLARFTRLARRAVIVNDLRRHRVPWAFIAVAARLCSRSAMVVHDGPLSVLRGFVPDELLSAARQAGSRKARVVRRWPYRVVLTIPATAPRGEREARR